MPSMGTWEHTLTQTQYIIKINLKKSNMGTGVRLGWLAYVMPWVQSQDYISQVWWPMHIISPWTPKIWRKDDQKFKVILE